MKVIIILSLLVWLIANIKAAPDITVQNGVVEVTNGCCNITNGPLTKELCDNRSEGYMFGLILYNCNGVYGYKVSKMNCAKCGLYCVANDYIEGCQNTYLQITVGVVIGVVSSIVILLIFKTGFDKIIKSLWIRTASMIQSRRDIKDNKRAARLSLMTKTVINPVYKEKFNNLKPSVYKNRVDGHNCTSESSSIKGVNCTARYSGLEVVTLSIMTCLMLTISAQACDMSFYLRNNGKICTDAGCSEMDMYTFPLTYGKTVCFMTTDGKNVKFHISESYTRDRYNIMYYTGNVTTSVETNWACDGTDECDNNKCRMDSMSKKLVVAKGEPSYTKYGCHTHSSSCDTYCFFRQMCVYYKLDIVPFGKMYPVYSRVSSIWEIELSMTKDDVVYKTILNVNNPTSNIGMVSDIKSNFIPISINNPDYEMVNRKDGGVMIDRDFYEIMVSDKNMPTLGMVGDTQLSIDKKSFVVNGASHICQIDNCKAQCRVHEPTVNRLLGNKASYNMLKVWRSLNNGDVIEVRNKIRPTASISFGKISVDSMFVRDSLCKFRVIMTYGCVSCTDRPLVVLQAYDIKEEGTMGYNSNCTLDRMTLACSKEPFEVYIMENYKNCQIYIPKTNQSLQFDVKYNFLGNLSPMKTIVSQETSYEIAKSVVSSGSFISSTINTVTTCTIIGTTIAVITRLFKMYMYTKVMPKEDI